MEGLSRRITTSIRTAANGPRARGIESELQKHLVAMQWTLEGYTDLARQIMNRLSRRVKDISVRAYMAEQDRDEEPLNFARIRRGVTEANMLLHVSDLTGRGEEDEELVKVVRWLLGELEKAVEDAELRNLAWDSSPDNAWYAPIDHPFTNGQASHAYESSQQSIPHMNVTTAEAARAAYISKMWDILEEKLTEMHLEILPCVIVSCWENGSDVAGTSARLHDRLERPEGDTGIEQFVH
ncbi:unnamed protein product [Zymoseptoria tritici ST99CH_3D1]|uniref:Uncharacterized protein n=1 Tax=Zymoseptoria tritici (strain ST99CH_3D7) TaxID=1276538 RepID=A0A1X7RS94_ZYMT9|nr:unnamed protein product [Zymoseptoria tritici ST99CH_3D7]SMR52368.1 unnamed protein product [Zymoseptoria tritici ST99CH_3D1]